MALNKQQVSDQKGKNHKDYTLESGEPNGCDSTVKSHGVKLASFVGLILILFKKIHVT
jgi:hypothetical protein